MLMVSRMSSSVFGKSGRWALVVVMTLGACADTTAPQRGMALTQGPTRLEERVYRLASGDKLKVSVYGEQDLSGQFEVNAQGNLPMPLIGEIAAKGKSANELRDQIAQRLSDGYLRNPKVSVEVQTYRPFYVHGEVRNSGEFQFKQGLRIRDAVAMAGGYSYRANQGVALLSREGDSNEIQVPLPSDIAVLPGDNIRIPERYF
jgi:protein involved in polysaccharide export with SLBB domain